MKQIDLNGAKTELQDLARQNVLYVDNNIAIVRSVKDITLTDEAFLVNSFVTATVIQGHATLTIDNEEYNISAGDTFVCTPRNIIDNAMISVDFDLFGMIVSPKFGQQLSREIGVDIPTFTISASHKIIHLSSDELDVFLKYYSLLTHVCLKEPSIIRERELHHALLAAAIEMFEVFAQDENKPVETSGYTAAEQTFARFIQLLHESNSPLHSVNEYADRLHITPKYFSAICKQMAGRTASDIINEELVSSARILLRDPQNSIKMVADKLNFANQSHFGTFIRRHTGMSPQQLRETL